MKENKNSKNVFSRKLDTEQKKDKQIKKRAYEVYGICEKDLTYH